MTNILIVDDSATMRKIIQRTLRQTGLDVTSCHEAADGAKGLEVLNAESIDLIFSDVNMPEMDGLEFVRAIRADRPTDPKIVMVTTEVGSDSVSEALKSGADGYVKKPFTPDDLEKAVNELGI